jgi:hypothetical protein
MNWSRLYEATQTVFVMTLWIVLLLSTMFGLFFLSKKHLTLSLIIGSILAFVLMIVIEYCIESI